jgi:hypothetical protein
MAAGTVSNFTIYDAEYQTAQLEVLAKNLNVFNAASNGAIILRDRAVLGDYERNTVFDLPSTVAWRDNTSTSSVADSSVTDSEQVGVKVNLKYSPFAMTDDAWRKKGQTPETFSAMLGASNAVRKMEYLIGAATGILGNKLTSVAAVTNDITSASTNTLNHTALAGALAKFGDQSAQIACWVMHSKAYWDLISNGLAGATLAPIIYEQAGAIVYGGQPATYGKPVVVTDAASYNEADSSGDYDRYWTLGLTKGAITLDQSEPDVVVSDLVTGQQNITHRIQGEFAINFSMRNCTWDVTHGGANPPLATLFTASNWDSVFADAKLLPGVVVISR